MIVNVDDMDLYRAHLEYKPERDDPFRAWALWASGGYLTPETCCGSAEKYYVSSDIWDDESPGAYVVRDDILAEKIESEMCSKLTPVQRRVLVMHYLNGAALPVTIRIRRLRMSVHEYVKQLRLGRDAVLYGAGFFADERRANECC